MSEIEIRRESLDEEGAKALIPPLNAELQERYPEEGANHFRLDPDEIAPGRGLFLVAYRDGRPVACGAVRRISEETGEVKRMYVLPEARGLGLGRRILESLEAEAASLGLLRLVLETGTRQYEAQSLYESAGFVETPRFGEYESSPLSLCMEKKL